MVTDEELAELIERAAADVHPVVDVLINKAAQQGRRRRRRRLAWIAGTNAVAVVAIASMAAALAARQPGSGAATGLRGTSASSSQPTGSQPTGSQPVGGNTASATPSASASTVPPPAKPMTRAEMLAVLRSLLPPGSQFSDVHTDTSPGALEVNYNDGQGQVDIMLDITPFDEVLTQQRLHPTVGTSGSSAPGIYKSQVPKVPWVLALSCPHPLWTDEGTRPVGALPISCAVRRLPNGGIERDAVMYADEFGFYGYDIYLQRPDHTEVFIQVANGYFDPYLPHVDRATPPGSMALWESVVQSPALHA